MQLLEGFWKTAISISLVNGQPVNRTRTSAVAEVIVRRDALRETLMASEVEEYRRSYMSAYMSPVFMSVARHARFGRR
jgi:hypothetical protein